VPIVLESAYFPIGLTGYMIAIVNGKYNLLLDLVSRRRGRVLFSAYRTLKYVLSEMKHPRYAGVMSIGSRSVGPTGYDPY